jgi:CheY-like chemotaxis protein
VTPVAVLPRTVLLVDDDPDMRLYLRSCLTAPGSPFDRVMEAADGLDALRLVRAGGVHVVVCDAVGAGVDGRRLGRAIRSDAALAHVAVLLLLDDGDASSDETDGCLTKPFNGRQLLVALDELPTRPLTARRPGSCRTNAG